MLYILILIMMFLAFRFAVKALDKADEGKDRKNNEVPQTIQKVSSGEVFNWEEDKTKCDSLRILQNTEEDDRVQYIKERYPYIYYHHACGIEYQLMAIREYPTCSSNQKRGCRIDFITDKILELEERELERRGLNSVSELVAWVEGLPYYTTRDSFDSDIYGQLDDALTERFGECYNYF